MTREMEVIGALAWRAFVVVESGIDPNSESMPGWLDLPAIERVAWCAAASAVAGEFKRRTQDVFYGFVTL